MVKFIVEYCICKIMSKMYNFKIVESKWQKIWLENNTDLTPKISENDKNKKLYVLEMLPYPSGKIHMGHVRNYTIGDIVARFKKSLGFKILHPMGWDSFGMPAENAAMKHKIHPKDWTNNNIKAMKQSLIPLGFSYDWSREISTCSEEYYGLEQHFFIDLYEKGLIYRKDSFVNWDPVDNTVLANEQVIDGCGWRSGAKVIKKKIPHWCVKITDYAEELLENIDSLSSQHENTGWPEKVLAMQKNWIGKSFGLETKFFINDKDKTILSDYSLDYIDVFTTRPETLFGASFCAIAPEHPIAAFLSKKDKLIASFIEECLSTPVTESAMSTAEKLGFDTGIYVQNPFDKTKTVKLFIANFVLMEYGTGAVFGCPAHDERDFEFATKYNLPITSVINSENSDLPYTETIGKMKNSQFLDGLNVLDARETAIVQAEKLNIGIRKTTYRLRDWTVSRQRYWGCPIPMIHCEKCGVVPVPKKDLPVLLPNDVSFDSVGNPLDKHDGWKNVVCPKCGMMAKRETDTLDTFFESSWYFLRYCCPKYIDPIDKEEVNKWMPVDIYIGGIEHAVLHLLYARFFSMALNDLGYINFREPFKTLLTQGMVCHTSFKDKDGNWLYPEDVDKIADGSYIHAKTGEEVTAIRAEKMSKSKNNVIDPNSMIDTYGADALRLFIMSDTPYDKDFYWNTEALDGSWRYVNKMWRLSNEFSQKYSFSDVILAKKIISEGILDDIPSILKTAHSYLSKIKNCLDSFSFHKAIALHRELTREIEDYNFNDINEEIVADVLYIWIASIFPFTPHFSLESFEKLFNPTTVVCELPWPKFREDLAAQDSVTIAVQVCGKLRGTFVAEFDSDDEVLKKEAMNVENVQKFINDKEVKKIVVVKNKLVNFVVV